VDVDGDGNADLLIGSPYARANQSGESPTQAIQRGSVRVFLSTTNRKSGSALKDESSDYELHGDQFSYFGSVIRTVTVSQQSLLLVGAPGYRSSHPDGQITVGRVYAFSIGKGGLNSKALFTVTSTEQLSTTGFSLAVGYPQGVTQDPVLALSSPTRNTADNSKHAGTVWILGLSKLVAGGDFLLTTNASFVQAIINSNRWGTRLGWSMLLQDLTGDGLDDLVVSAPFFTVDPPDAANRERGLVLLWRGGSNFPSGVIDDARQDAHWEQIGPTERAHFGNTLFVNDVNGDGKPELLISAPRADYIPNPQEYFEMSGALHVFAGPF